jgi:hypothetical protein
MSVHIKYKVIYAPGLSKLVLVSDEEIETGELFLYLGKEVVRAKNPINVHDNSTHYKLIAGVNELPDLDIVDVLTHFHKRGKDPILDSILDAVKEYPL